MINAENAQWKRGNVINKRRGGMTRQWMAQKKQMHNVSEIDESVGTTAYNNMCAS